MRMRKVGIQEGRNGGDDEGLRARLTRIRLEFTAEGGEDAEGDESIEQKGRQRRGGRNAPAGSLGWRSLDPSVAKASTDLRDERTPSAGLDSPRVAVALTLTQKRAVFVTVC